MRSVADAKWSATRNSSVASCYQPSSCLVDDDFHLGSLSSVVKCLGDPRLPIAVCGHAASGAERPLPVWASTRRLPGVRDQDRPLCQRRAPFRIGRRGDRVISWQLPPDAIPRGFEPVSDADMPAEHDANPHQRLTVLSPRSSSSPAPRYHRLDLCVSSRLRLYFFRR
jgi:hypothetical protein